MYTLPSTTNYINGSWATSDVSHVLRDYNGGGAGSYGFMKTGMYSAEETASIAHFPSWGAGVVDDIEDWTEQELADAPSAFKNFLKNIAVVDGHDLLPEANNAWGLPTGKTPWSDHSWDVNGDGWVNGRPPEAWTWATMQPITS